MLASTIAEMVRLGLRGDFVPYAVNGPAGGEVADSVRSFLGLAEQLGAILSILSALAEGPVRSLRRSRRLIAHQVLRSFPR